MTKIVFSFDDGREDNIKIIQDIFVKTSIPATFNITTDYISNILLLTEKPCMNKALSKEQLMQIANYKLIEIAGHGKKHSNEFMNLIDGICELREWLPNNKICGIASPYSQAKVQELIADKTKYTSYSISYIRLGDRITSFRFIKKILRKLNRMFFHIPFVFAWVHEQTFVDESDDFILYSVPILRSDTVGEVQALIKRAIKKDKNLILMLHSILHKGEPEYNSDWSWDWDKFETLITNVKDMQRQELLKVVTTQDLMSGN